MICDMTYLGQLVIFRELDLKSDFEADLLRSNYTWFGSSRRDKHDGATIMAVPFKMKVISEKKIFHSKQLF